MKGIDQLKSHLLLHYVLQHQPELIQQLLDNPTSVLKRVGVDEEAMKCPDEAHKAFNRGENFAKEVKALDVLNLVDALPKIAEIAREIFGKDLIIAKAPFGLRFSERLRDIKFDWTATGSGTITFGGLDGDSDVDG